MGQDSITRPTHLDAHETVTDARQVRLRENEIMEVDESRRRPCDVVSQDFYSSNRFRRNGDMSLSSTTIDYSLGLSVGLMDGTHRGQ